MKSNIANRLPKSSNNACQLLFLFSDGKLKGQARKFDTDNDGLVKRLYKSGDFTAKTNQTLLLHGLRGTACDRVLLIGLGDRAKADASIWQKASAAAANILSSTPSTSVVSDCLVCVEIKALNSELMAEHLAREIVNAGYRFTSNRSQQSEPRIEELYLSCDRSLVSKIQLATTHGIATANGMALTRNLGNLAPNICTPGYLADQAQNLADQFDNFTTQIIDEDAMQEMGMGAFLSVSAGSEQPGKLIVMNYQGKKRSGSPIVLVGKGITFDTGGISIKSSEGMDEMKFDMCGAASVFGVMQAIGELQPDTNIIGVVAAAENMPDGRATRPGDIVTSMSGKTIEILNTDAEGRMVLCDALTYSKRFKPAAIIDIATLTGAAVTALGHHRSAVFGNHQGTVDALCAAGEASGDLTWPMPMGSDYLAQLDSNFADLANIGGRPAGAITAACFLSCFAQDMKWAHLDIAGVAWNSGKQKGATGRPVPLLLTYISHCIKT
ncbi:MAG: leucyl aminopeptidase [Granulosicoccus sp.]